jgi:hypothetical protein
LGTAVLWAADPVFAGAAEVEEQRDRGGDGYSGDGGYSENDGDT